MNLIAKSFAVYAPADHQKYLRDLFCRMAMDEELIEPAVGDHRFYVVVYTQKEYEALCDK